MPLVTLPDKAALLIGASRMGAMLHGGRVVWRGPLPVLTVTDGTITTFTRGGVDYTQVLWRQSGSFTLSGDVTLQGVLVGGGASGGRNSNNGAGMGGGGAGEPVDISGLTLAGEYSIAIGAGGAAQVAAAPGNVGSSSVISIGGSPAITAQGGGAGGGAGSADGGAGACGGGGAGLGIGGIGTITNGGASNTSGGGGGGAGGNGLDGVSSVSAGNGGDGITLLFTEPVMDICGGGGGSGYNAALPGTASHGGTAGAAGTSSESAVNGGGSGASTQGTAGAGGDGLFVLVVRSDEVIVEMAE